MSDIVIRLALVLDDLANVLSDLVLRLEIFAAVLATRRCAVPLIILFNLIAVSLLGASVLIGVMQGHVVAARLPIDQRLHIIQLILRPHLWRGQIHLAPYTVEIELRFRLLVNFRQFLVLHRRQPLDELSRTVFVLVLLAVGSGRVRWTSIDDGELLQLLLLEL